MTELRGKVKSVNKSKKTGERKYDVGSSRIVVGHGLEGDAHGGDWHRQVSLLAQESIDKMREKGLEVDPGAFGENLTTEGLDLAALPLGTLLRVGEEVLLKITQIGKECETPCSIFYQVGDCVMPREGIFTEVERGGVVEAGDGISVETPGDVPGDD